MRNNLIIVRAYCIRPLFTAILAVALAFTLSCSGDDGGDGGNNAVSSSSLVQSSSSGTGAWSSSSSGSSSSSDNSSSGGSSSSGGESSQSSDGFQSCFEVNRIGDKCKAENGGSHNAAFINCVMTSGICNDFGNIFECQTYYEEACKGSGSCPAEVETVYNQCMASSGANGNESNPAFIQCILTNPICTGYTTADACGAHYGCN